MTFHRGDARAAGTYAPDGHEVLTYDEGNRGVRFVFAKVDGDAGAPAFIQFGDHAMAPVKATHDHLYRGDDRTALLSELSNWPPCYPSSLTADDVVHAMLHP